MQRVEPPAVHPMGAKRQISDIERFAKAYFNIELTDAQMQIIAMVASGSKHVVIQPRRKMGINTANKVILAYLQEGIKLNGRARLPQYELPAHIGKTKLKNKTQHGRVLEMIQRPGGAFNFELSRISLRYGGTIFELRKDGHNHKEGEPHKPSNPYSASKAAQEDICYAYWRTYDLPIAITNTMNIIGEMQDPEKFLPMLIKGIQIGRKVTIHANADGSKIGSRYYLHARNQADALIFLLKGVEFPRYGEGNDIGRFNVVGEYEINNLELAQKVADILGKELRYELVDFHSSRPGHDLRYALDGSKMAALGWKAPLTFDESLKNTVEWTIAHPEWLK